MLMPGANRSTVTAFSEDDLIVRCFLLRIHARLEELRHNGEPVRPGPHYRHFYVLLHYMLLHYVLLQNMLRHVLRHVIRSPFPRLFPLIAPFLPPLPQPRSSRSRRRCRRRRRCRSENTIATARATALRRCCRRLLGRVSRVLGRRRPSMLGRRELRLGRLVWTVVMVAVGVRRVAAVLLV